MQIEINGVEGIWDLLGIIISLQRQTAHTSLEQNLTIRSHDGGKEGHFYNCGDTSIHLPLTRSAQQSGQLSL